MKKTGDNTHLLIITFVFFLLSFFLTSATLFPQANSLKNDDVRKKRLEVLEKLENGTALSSEEIRSSYGNSIADVEESDFICCPEMGNIWSKIYSSPGPFLYQYHDGKEHKIISDKDFEEIHRHLNNSLEELRRDIGSFRNSEDFLIMQDELKKWNDSFIKELEKMREEMIRSERKS